MDFASVPLSETQNKNGDFLNAFGEYKTTIKKWENGYWAGRRELLMGHERILSPGNWLLNRHTYDGIGGWAVTPKGKRVEGFLVRPRIPVPDFWSTKDDETVFWGFFYTDTIPVSRRRMAPRREPRRPTSSSPTCCASSARR